MAEKCRAPHPEVEGAFCKLREEREHHEQHMALVDLEPLYWPNDEYVAPPAPSKLAKNVKTKLDLEGIASEIPREEKRRPDFVHNRERAIAAGAQAQKQVDEAASEAWKNQADEIIERLAMTRPMFSADDVWKEGLERTLENRGLGPRMSAAARRGLISKSSTVGRSDQVQCHGMPRHQWMSLVYQSPAEVS